MICVAEFFILVLMTLCNVVAGSGNCKNFWIHCGVTFVGCKLLDQLFVKVCISAHLIIFVLVVRTLGMAITLQAWMDADAGPGAGEVVCIRAGDTVEARLRTRGLAVVRVIKHRLVNDRELQPGGGVFADNFIRFEVRGAPF